MYGKIFFSLVLVLSIIALLFIIDPVRKIKKPYGLYLKRIVAMAMIAMASNIVIAFSTIPLLSEIAYCTYFSSLDWLILALVGFVIAYSEYFWMIKKFTVPTVLLIVADTIFMFANLFFHHQFEIYEYYNSKGVLFLLTRTFPLYNIHLTIDYIGAISCIIYLAIKIIRSHGFYKYKYRAVIIVVALIIVLNIVYMAFKLPLDLSVVFYALAASLVYFFSEKFVPKILSNQTVKKAVNEMNEGLILFDIDGECIYVNDFAKKHFKIDENDCTAESEPVATVVEGRPMNEVMPGQFTYVKPAASPEYRDKHYRISYNRILDGKGHYLGSYILADDVTEEYYVMEELAVAKEEADGANAAKSNFLANMSHEIRTPLNSLLGMNEMIIREASDNRLKEYAENIKVAGNSLLSLLNDILDFSKIEAGRMSIVEADYSIHKVLRDCYNILGPSAHDKGLELTIECDDTTPAVMFGDEMRIRQILSNLLSNAIKYTLAGSVKVRVWYEMVNDRQVGLKMSVTDTGIGISPENQKILFDAFQRVDESRNRNIEGTGLGLTITRELTAMMNGHISVESEPDEGSCFTVVIPQAIVNPGPVGPFKVGEIKEGGEYHESFTAPDAKILVVDDVPMNLKVVKALLGKTKVDVQIARGGDEAIERCLDEKFDLVFMDHMMPAPDGVEAFKRIREKGVNTETPVIVLTANALSGAEEEYRRIGFIDYLSTPVKGGDLEQVLVKYLPKEKVNIS